MSAGQVEQARRELVLALAAAESAHSAPMARAKILDALGSALLFRAGRYEQAAVSFNPHCEAVDAACWPNSHPVQRRSGLSGSGDHARSEKYLRQVLEIAPAEPHAWRLLGSILVKRNKLQEAEAAEQKASLGDASVTASVWGDLALIQEARGNHLESAVALRRSIGLTQPATSEPGCSPIWAPPN